MRQRRSIIHKSPWMGLVLGVFVALVFVLAPLPILDIFEYRVRDQMMRFRGASQGRSDIVMVAISNDDLTQLGRWPWSRVMHGLFLEYLEEKVRTKAIVFDIFFPEPEEGVIPGDSLTPDEYFLLRIASAGNVYLANVLQFNEPNELPSVQERGDEIRRRFGIPLPKTGTAELQSAVSAINSITPLTSVAKGVGMINCEPDPDGITRRIFLVAEYGGTLFFSMDLLVVCDLLNIPLRDLTVIPGEFIQIPIPGNPIRIPIDRQGRMLINFHSSPTEDPYISNAVKYHSILAAQRNEIKGATSLKTFDMDSLKDTTVLVGMTAEGTPETDIKAVPFNNNYPLVSLHAHTIANILNRDFLYETPPWLANIILIVIGLLLGLMVQRLPPLRSFLATLLILILWYLTSLFFFLRVDYLLPTVLPIIVIVLTFALVVLYHYLTEQRQRRWATTLLGSYVNEETIREIIDNPDLLRPGGTRIAVTVLFSDIRGFTAMAEQIPAEEVVALLNEHFGLMTEVIHRYNGTVDKFVGDEIMALFGAPKPLENSVLNAVRAALEMQKVMGAIQERRSRTGYRTFQIAIGIHTGDAVVGHLGTEKKLQYTAIGDNVNLAKRLEAQALGGQILISRAVQDRIHNTIPATPMTPIRVKGKAEPVEVFEVQVS